jgi:hypothetical protein
MHPDRQALISKRLEKQEIRRQKIRLDFDARDTPSAIFLLYGIEIAHYFLVLPFYTPAHTPANHRDTPSRGPILAQEAVGA